MTVNVVMVMVVVVVVGVMGMDLVSEVMVIDMI